MQPAPVAIRCACSSSVPCEMKHGHGRQKRCSTLGLGSLVLLLMATWGCGNAMYALDANSASSKLAEARELGAEQYAPYEYYMAVEHLQKAQTEAAEADYGDASELSDLAAEYAEKAVVLSREAHRGAGR